jgi:large subunit ribosomal protein L1
VKSNENRHTDAAVPQLEALNIYDAMTEVKAKGWAKFDESVDVSIRLGVNPTKPNQSIRGAARLPFGSGKKAVVAVFARDEDAAAATAAGADFVGAEDLIEMVEDGEMPFTRVIATPEMAPKLGKIAKILGPRGLMPNAKTGTLTTNIARAVSDAKGGSVTFKVQRQGVINVGIGRMSYSKEHLLENVRAVMTAVTDLKPEGFKGTYLKGMAINSTMGPGIEVERASVDPANPRFMLDPSEY